MSDTDLAHSDEEGWSAGSAKAKTNRIGRILYNLIYYNCLKFHLSIYFCTSKERNWCLEVLYSLNSKNYLSLSLFIMWSEDYSSDSWQGDCCRTWLWDSKGDYSGEWLFNWCPQRRQFWAISRWDLEVHYLYHKQTYNQRERLLYIRE